MDIFNRHPEMLTKLVRKQSLLPLMLTLETSNDQVVSSVLQLMVQMIRYAISRTRSFDHVGLTFLSQSNESILSHLCVMGLIPVITNWAFHTHPMPVRIQAATLIQRYVLVFFFFNCYYYHWPKEKGRKEGTRGGFFYLFHLFLQFTSGEYELRGYNCWI